MKYLVRLVFFSIAIFNLSCSGDDESPCIEFTCLSDAEKTRVIDFVDSAYQYYTTNGAEKAYEEFSDPAGQFIDDELYIFVVDIENYDSKIATILAHGFQAELIGENVFHLEDIYGTNIIEKQIAGSDNAENQGWSEFYWDNPETQSIGKKFAYIIKTGNLLIGSGTYR